MKNEVGHWRALKSNIVASGLASVCFAVRHWLKNRPHAVDTCLLSQVRLV